MQQLRNISPFSQYVPGDLVEVPDGAAYDPFHWEPVVPAEPAPADPPRLPDPPKEM